VGVHLPPVVVIHFAQYIDFELHDIRITTRSIRGTEAVIIVPRKLPGADRSATLYPEEWPLGPTNTPLFYYDQAATTASTTPPVPSSSAPPSPATLDSAPGPPSR
jgi:hypothetical protein